MSELIIDIFALQNTRIVVIINTISQFIYSKNFWNYKTI